MLFTQRRYGLNGEEILVYKFRTMRVTEDGAHVQQASRDDPRITPAGRILRKYSLDELPQLINVLQGRMSLVGPRPHAVAHNEMYRKLINGYMVRHKVLPGITGLAQVNGLRGETKSLEQMEARVRCDLEYLRNWSVGLDLQILAKTAIRVLERPGGLLTEPPYRARLREATRTDWRFLLGVSPDDVVLAAGTDALPLSHSLSPWVRTVHQLGQPEFAEVLDWVFFSGTVPSQDGTAADVMTTLRRAFDALRPGGHMAITLENRWGLHWLADWRTSQRGPHDQKRPGSCPARHGLRWHRDRLRRLGADEICSYALLPSRDAPRAIIPVDPPCPPEAQKMALDQVWQRPSPSAAIVRKALGALVSSGLMRRLYPHYLLVGRKPC